MDFNFEKEENNWPSFVDLMTTFVFLLILILIFARFSEVLIERAKRMAVQEKIKLEISKLKTKSGKALTCDNPKDAKIKFHIRIPTDDLFDSGSDKLNDIDLIVKLGNIIKKFLDKDTGLIERIGIYGHSDIMPISTTAAKKFRSNLGLSAMRAVSVHDVLVNKCNIDSKKILVVGVGEFEPIVYKEFNKTEKYPELFTKVLQVDYSNEYFPHKGKYLDKLQKLKDILAPNRRVEIVLFFKEFAQKKKNKTIAQK